MSKYKKLSQERKELQAKGLLPDWYITPGYQMFVSRYEYDTKGRSVLGQFERIAATAAKHLAHIGKEQEGYHWFVNLLWKGWLSPSTPVLANMGTTRGMPVSCAANVVEDSIDGFYSALRECAILSKLGFGTASYLGDIRPRGSKIADGNKASGILPVLKDFVTMTRNVSQGGVRRGAWAGYIPIEHGDFDEIVDYISSEPDDVNIGWCVSDEFITSLNNKEVEATRRFQRSMKLKMVTGRGYFFFTDKVNRHVPEMYKKHGLTVKCSQLCQEITLFSDKDHTYSCQPASASLLTPSGLSCIGDVNIGDKIWSKEGWTNVVNKVSTGIKDVYEYRTSLGSFIGTTDHRIVQDSVKIEVDEAESIDGVSYHHDFESSILPEFVVHGLVIGDGTFRNSRTQLCVGENDYDYYNSEISEFISKDGYSFFRNVLIDTFDCTSNVDIRDFDIEMLDTYSKKVSFLRGIFSANGSAIATKDGLVKVVLSQTSKSIVDKVMLLLQSIGLSPRVHDKKGVVTTFSNGQYLCKDSYSISLLRNSDVELFCNKIGFIQGYKMDILKNRRSLKIEKPRRFNAEIQSKTYLGSFEVFHIEVDNESHTYWHNGLDVSNCVLSSMNLATYDEWKDTDAVFWATVFLDCVCEEFLTKARSISGLEKIVRCTEKGRALGLGVCGLHTYMQDHSIVFESLDAQFKMCEMFELMQKESNRASQWMAVELGEPEWCEGFGVRNTHTMTCPPTKSTSLLMAGVSEGVSPNPSSTYTQQTASGEIDRINGSLVAVMKAKGKFNYDEIDKIVDDGGSVQNVDWLDDHEKAVFRTAFEMNQNVLLRYAALRNKFVDQWQSVNLFIAADSPEEVVAELHEDAFNNEQIEGLYYIVTRSGYSHQSKINTESCESCQ